MNRALLEEPFPVELVRTRKGSFGHELSYIEAVHYIRRLNDAFDGQWSFKILAHENHGAAVTVHGVLEADGQVKHAFGNSAITVNKTTGEIVSLGDDLKAAATDALKKACSLFGIGLNLYLVDKTPERPSRAPQRPRGNGHAQEASPRSGSNGTPRSPVQVVGKGKPNGNGAGKAQPDDTTDGEGNGEDSGRERLTAKQLRCLYAVAHSKGLSDAELKQESLSAHGTAPEFLNRKSASDLIETLNCL